MNGGVDRVQDQVQVEVDGGAGEQHNAAMSGTVMVTGGTGYLGTAILEELLARGWQVRALVRDADRLQPGVRGRVAACRGDILDPPSLRDAMRGVTAVIHAAGIAADWIPDPRRFESVNVTGTANVLAAALEAGVPRLLATSTVMVFGPTDGLEAADERTAPPAGGHLLAYQRTKARAATLLKQARGRGPGIAIVYPGALYGPGPLTEGNYLARVMHQLRTGGYPALPRTAGLRWCLAHVRDVATGHVRALERGDPDGDWILGGDNVAFDRMLEFIRDGLALPRLPPKVPGSMLLLGLRALVAWHATWGTRPPMSLGGGRALLRDWAFSSALAAKEIGYRWRPFEEAFPEFVRWFGTLREPFPPA